MEVVCIYTTIRIAMVRKRKVVCYSLVPIWGHANIVALILERFFEYMYVLAVPGNKFSGKMYLEKRTSAQGGINSIHPVVPEYSGRCRCILCLCKSQLELPPDGVRAESWGRFDKHWNPDTASGGRSM